MATSPKDRTLNVELGPGEDGKPPTSVRFTEVSEIEGERVLTAMVVMPTAEWRKTYGACTQISITPVAVD